MSLYLLSATSSSHLRSSACHLLPGYFLRVLTRDGLNQVHDVPHWSLGFHLLACLCVAYLSSIQVCWCLPVPLHGVGKSNVKLCVPQLQLIAVW